MRLADIPALARVLRGAGYHKHSASVRIVTGPVTLTAPYWDSGSREEHFLLDLETGHTSPVAFPPSAWPKPPASATVDLATLPASTALVTGGIFASKSATWSVRMTADTARAYGVPLSC